MLELGQTVGSPGAFNCPIENKAGVGCHVDSNDPGVAWTCTDDSGPTASASKAGVVRACPCALP